MTKILKGANARGAASPFAEFLAGFGIAGALYYAGLRGLQGELALNEFVSFLGAMMLAFQPVHPSFFYRFQKNFGFVKIRFAASLFKNVLK